MKIKIKSFFLGVVVVGLIFLPLIGTIQKGEVLKTSAATINYVVDIGTDNDFAQPAITCDDDSLNGNCSLRQAIADAATHVSGDVLITFANDVTEVSLTDVSGDNGLDDLDQLTQLDHSITIDGANNVTIINDGGQYSHLFQIGSPTANSTNNIIRNLTIRGFANGITIYGDNNRVENVLIDGQSNEASCIGEIGIIVSNRNSYDTAEGNRIMNNEINCFRKGILAVLADDVVISGNTIAGNNVDNEITFAGDTDVCYTAGIQIQGTMVYATADYVSNPVISNNTIENNGFAFDPDSITGCTEHDFLSAGIIIDGGDDIGLSVPLPAYNVEIEHNVIRNNHGSGLVLRNTLHSIVSENAIYRNGIEAATDSGNGVTLMCNRESETEYDGSMGNRIDHNTIYNNADNGIQVQKSCADPNGQSGDFLAGTMAFNAFLGNSIYANGFIDGDSPDGISIDLEEDASVGGAAFTEENPYVSLNDTGDEDTGGNNMLNSPVIDGATYNDVTGVWSISGTVDDLNMGSGAIIELYQVGCAGDLSSFSIENCDADRAEGETDYGYGEGKTFLGRIVLPTTRDDNNWTADLPVDVGFAGGLLTSTVTTTSMDDERCAMGVLDNSLYLNSDDFLPENLACDTSEFGANFLATVSSNALTLNSFVAYDPISQGQTQVIHLVLANSGNTSFTNVAFSNQLPAGLSYIPESCVFSTSLDEETVIPCELDGNTIVFEDAGDLPMSPGTTYYVRLEATVDEDADLGPVTNTGSVVTEPEYETDLISTKQFVIEAYDSGSNPLLTCTDPDATDTEPNATFMIDDVAHSLATFNTTPHTATFEPTYASTGNAEFAWEWRLDGTLIASGSGTTLEPQDIALTAGAHVVSFNVEDCNGDRDQDVVALSVVSGSTNTTLTLSKTITPTSPVRNGDLVTVDIAAKSGSSSQNITALTLDDTFTGLSSSVPVCNFAINTLPTSESSSCTVANNGNIALTLPNGGLDAGDTVNIRYLATVSGTQGTYTNAVSYVSSTPALAATPASFAVEHEIIASPTACSGSETVDAELTVNEEATPSSTFAATAAGSFTFANSSTSGDGTITYHWFINDVLQSSETGDSITRTLSTATEITLVKTDCNGSTDIDTVTVTFSASGTPGPFTVLKRTADNKDKYALSSRTVSYEVAITNTDTAAAHVYSLVDPIPNAFIAAVTVTDAAGGTEASAARQVIVNNIPIAAGETAVVEYTLTLESRSDFPLDGYDLDSSADEGDDDLYFDAVNEASISTSGNSHSSTRAITGAPDGRYVSLGEDGEIIVELEADKAVVDGSGDDFALYLVNNHSDDTDKASEDRRVSVSQDGEKYVRVSSDDNGYDISRTRLSWIKFIKVEDMSSTVAAKAPGTDIDAVCILNVGVPVGANAQVTSGSTSHSASNQVYIDVTRAFDNPLRASDCAEPESNVTPLPTTAAPIIKDARTVELPPAPVATPTPTPAPVHLPKTGPEIAVAGIGTLITLGYFFRRRKK